MTTSRESDSKITNLIMAKLKSNVRNLFNCERVCGVCLSNTRDLRPGNTVYNISCGENFSERCLRDIIDATFGSEVTALLPTFYFCELCIDIILKAYRMLEDIRFNHQMLQCYSNKLIEQTKMKLPDDVQSIVFELDYPNNSKLEIYTNNNCNYSAKSDDDDVNDFSDDKLSNLRSKEIKEEKSVFVEVDISKNVCIKEEDSTGPVKLEIDYIMAKIQDQITFKKLGGKTDKPKHSVPSTRKVPTKPKIVGKHTTGPTTKKMNKPKNPKDKYYKCYLCESTFTGEKELLKHSRKQCMEQDNCSLNNEDNSGNMDKVKKEVCDQCGKIVASNYLKKHKILHERMQKQCQICSQFINKGSFNKHMDMHSGQPKMRRCPHCEYETKYGEALDAHVNKEHLHVRPYTCEKCQKGFHSKLLLREHVRIHTRLKTEQCHLCGDRFAYKKSLILHMRLHTGYAPYKCNLCEESFISASRRQTHVQSKHLGRVLQCDYCPKKFSLRTTLRTHIIKIHQRKDKEKGKTVK